MDRVYRILTAKTEGGVIATARDDGWTLLKPTRQFSALDTDHDGTFNGAIGNIQINESGFVALAYKDI